MNESKIGDISTTPFAVGDVADCTWNRRVQSDVGVRFGDNGFLFSQHLQWKMWNCSKTHAKYSRCRSIENVKTVTVNEYKNNVIL